MVIKSIYLNANLWYLNKTLYGLYQSRRQWINQEKDSEFITISNYVVSNGFTQLITELCIFYKSDNNSILTYLIEIYIDDIIVTGLDKKIEIFINKIFIKFRVSKYQPIKSHKIYFK